MLRLLMLHTLEARCLYEESRVMRRYECRASQRV